MADADTPSEFIFVICQAGAEAAAREEMLSLDSAPFGPLKLAFSRPGFLTFKIDPDAPPPMRFSLPATLARTYGWSLGKATGSDAARLVDEIMSDERIRNCETIHVFERETILPGTNGFEPGVSALAAEVAELFRAHKRVVKEDVAVNRVARPDSRVADVVIVNPDEWWFGSHHAVTRAGRWPGGVPFFDRDQQHVSRAYFKLKEALLWAGITVNPGDVCAEIGSAPGGSCELLLEMGASVIAIDPAEPDIEHEDMKWIQRRGHEVRKRDFAGVRWLMADLSMQPQYTLDTVRDIIRHDSVQNVAGLILTLKLNDWDLIKKVPGYMREVRKWGFQVVRSRQLAFNRREFCLMAVRDKFVLRNSKQRSRATTDDAEVIARQGNGRPENPQPVIAQPTAAGQPAAPQNPDAGQPDLKIADKQATATVEVRAGTEEQKSGEDKSGKEKSGKNKSGKNKSGKGKDKSGKSKSGKEKSGKSDRKKDKKDKKSEKSKQKSGGKSKNKDGRKSDKGKSKKSDGDKKEKKDKKSGKGSGGKNKKDKGKQKKPKNKK